MPNVNDLKNSKFLTQHDVENGMLVTIEGYEEENVAKEGADTYVRVTWSGAGDTGKIHWHINWAPLTEAGFVSVV